MNARGLALYWAWRAGRERQEPERPLTEAEADRRYERRVLTQFEKDWRRDRRRHPIIWWRAVRHVRRELKKLHDGRGAL